MHLLSVFSLRNRALIALITIVIAVFGGIALTSLKEELIPSIQLPSVYVVTSDPGASPAVVAHDISTPIETALQGIENLDSTTATSATGSSTVTASFEYGTDITAYEQKVQVAVDRISSTLPSGVTPQVITFSTSDLPIISMAVTSDLDKHTLASQLSTLTLTDLKQLSGVSNVSLLGAVTQRITITPNSTTLKNDGLTVPQITAALQANGTLLGSGTITENGKTLTVQSGTKVSSLKELAALPLIGTTSKTVPTGIGTTTTVTVPKVYAISDVATVARVDDPITGYSRVNGKPSVTLSITKTAAGNTVAVSKAVRADIPTLEKQLGHNTKFTVVTDQAPSITTSINSLAEEGLLGLGFAVIIIFIFLFSIRSTIVAAISIPISVLITFIGMLASGYTLNVITLAGLTIAIGRVVDDSIVVIENIKRHIGLGEAKLPAILSAVREVAVAVTASTITTVAVFLPIALVSGLTGELFRPFALTVTIALAASLFVALTIVPVLAYWFLRTPGEVRNTQPRSAKLAAAGIAVAAVLAAAAIAIVAIAVVHNQGDGAAHPFAGLLPLAVVALVLLAGMIALIVVYRRVHFPHLAVSPTLATSSVETSEDELETPTRLQKVYLPVIRWTLRFPAIVLILAIVVLGGSVLLAKTSLTTNFIGNSGQNTLTVTQTLDKSTSLAAQDAASKKVESTLEGIKGVTTVEVSIGSGGNSLRAAFAGGGSTTYDVTTSSAADQDKLLATITSKMKAIKNEGTIGVSAASSGLTSSNIEIDVTAGSDADLRTASTALIAKAKKIAGVSTVTSNLSASLPYISVEIDRDKAAKDGLTELAVGSAVAQAMNPGSSGSIVVGDTTLDIYLDDADAPTTQAALKAFSIHTATGSTVPLSDLATVKTVKGPSSITTVKGLRSATIEVVPSTSNVGNLSALVQASVTKTKIPGSATATLGGFTSQQGDAFSQLGLALLAAILIVYVVMVAAFKSLRQPLLLLVSIPFAATGAIILQVISGVPLGVASLIGVLMLVGIVVTNAIVLVDLINQYRTRGMKVADAIIHGASRRLRPILMTALATIFALLPLGLGLSGHGSFISQPLAIVVIGGLVSSTLLTLVVLPVLYYLVEGAKERRMDRRAAAAGQSLSPTENVTAN